MSKAITSEELQQRLLYHFRSLAKYWAKQHPDSAEDACNGMAFSVLTFLDGCTGDMPSVELIARPHPDDKQYHIDNGEDWIEDGTVINTGGYLHELYYVK